MKKMGTVACALILFALLTDCLAGSGQYQLRNYISAPKAYNIQTVGLLVGVVHRLSKR